MTATCRRAPRRSRARRAGVRSPPAAGCRGAACRHRRRAARPAAAPACASPRAPRGAAPARSRTSACPRRSPRGPCRGSRSSRCPRGWRAASTTSSRPRRRSATAGSPPAVHERHQPRARARPGTGLAVPDDRHADAAGPQPPDAVVGGLDGGGERRGEERGGVGIQASATASAPTPFWAVRIAAPGQRRAVSSAPSRSNAFVATIARSAEATSPGEPVRRTVTVRLPARARGASGWSPHPARRAADGRGA